jgi:DNA-binding response OmpR family regulator
VKPYLTARERQIVLILEEAGRLVTLEKLLTALYGPDYLASNRLTLNTYIHRLRRKGYPIVTVRGIGFILGDDLPCPICGRELPA